MSNDTQRRTAFVTGLRDLAAFLQANPAVPVPTDPAIITYYPAQATDAALRAEVDRIAELFGTRVDPRVLPHGLYAVARCFGPVHYEVAVVLSTVRDGIEPPYDF